MFAGTGWQHVILYLSSCSYHPPVFPHLSRSMCSCSVNYSASVCSSMSWKSWLVLLMFPFCFLVSPLSILNSWALKQIDGKLRTIGVCDFSVWGTNGRLFIVCLSVLMFFMVYILFFFSKKMLMLRIFVRIWSLFQLVCMFQSSLCGSFVSKCNELSWQNTRWKFAFLSYTITDIKDFKAYLGNNNNIGRSESYFWVIMLCLSD